jgi:hypothetical protein
LKRNHTGGKDSAQASLHLHAKLLAGIKLPSILLASFEPLVVCGLKLRLLCSETEARWPLELLGGMKT